mgnify:CR=1 FL=1
MSRLNQERQKELEPKRFEYAKDQIIKAGFEITFEDQTRLEFTYRGSTIQFFPYSGWHSGKTIVDGRGIHKLLKQIL